jgi:hypothetical protein
MIRIPALLQTGTGALLAFAVGRRGSGGDYGWNDLLLRRSLDGGATWEPPQLVHGEAAAATIDNPCPIWDARRNVTVLLYVRLAGGLFRRFTTQRESKNHTYPRKVETAREDMYACGRWRYVSTRACVPHKHKHI